MRRGQEWLAHYGVIGQRWGVRRYQNSDGTLTAEGKKHYGSGEKQKTLFVSGSSKTQDPDSPYYRKELPEEVRGELDKSMRNRERIVVGDAPGIDRQVQEYLNGKDYDQVEVYGPGKEVRYTANKNWKTVAVDDPEHEPYSPEWLRKKDEFMTEISDKGLAVILDEGSKATRNNVDRLVSQNKDVQVYMLDKEHRDRWTDPDMATNPEEVQKSGKGSCHDQVMYEINMLKKMGYKPNALFVMESSGKQGGMTHSLVYFVKDGKVHWVENAWAERSGVHAFDSVKDIKKEIKKAHASGEFGDKSAFPSLSFGDFNADAQKPGETLQELVDHIKWD